MLSKSCNLLRHYAKKEKAPVGVFSGHFEISRIPVDASTRNSSKLPGSAVKLHTIQETETPSPSSFAEMTADGGNKTQHVVHTSTVSGAGGNFTQDTESITLAKPAMDVTEDDANDDANDVAELEEALTRKVGEIEYMTQLLNEKDELIDTLQDNIEDVQAQLEDYKKVEEANQHILEKAKEDEDKLVEVNNQLIEATNKIRDLELKCLDSADQNLREELIALREENQDRIKGMENLHGIIETSQKSIDEKKDEIMQLQQQLEKAKVDSNENESNKKSIQNYVEELQIKNGVISSLETELQISKENLNSLQSKFDDAQNADKILEEKQLLERQLERVTLEMASIQNVVTEMTKSFKQQIMLKDQEVKKYQEQNVSLSTVNMELQRKCRELEDIGRAHKEKLDDMEKRVAVTGADMKMDNGDNDDLEHGSLDDLSNLVQASV